MPLRDYQEAAIHGDDTYLGVLEAWKKYNNVLVSMPTASGKTRVGAALAGLWRDKAIEYGKPDRVLWLAQRDELIFQAADALEQVTGEQVAIEKGEQRVSKSAALFNRRIVVASVQTMLNAERREFFGRGGAEFGMLVVDECFPPDTPIDGCPIASIVPGDLVSCFDHRTGRPARRRVTRVFKKQTRRLLRLTTSTGRVVVCTPNHPFYIASLGLYVPAALLYNGVVLSTTPLPEADNGNETSVRDLRDRVHSEMAENSHMFQRVCARDIEATLRGAGPDAFLSGLRGPSQMLRNEAQGAGVTRSGLLLGLLPRGSDVQNAISTDDRYEQKIREPNIGANEAQESYGTTRGSRQGQHVTPHDGMEATSTRREWKRANGSRATHSVSLGLDLQHCGSNWQEAAWSSDVLQDRRWERGVADRHRSGRPIALFPQSPGSEKTGVLGGERLDRVEVLEPGGRGDFGGVCPGGVVYNLEVEGHHNYFANGILVHNCQHIVCEGHMQVVEYFSPAKLCGLTGTPDRADEISLGKVLEHVAFHYEILDAMRDGWLAPIRQEFIEGVELDFSGVGLDANGDMKASDLDEIIRREEPLHKIASATVKLAGQRQTMVFTPSIASAHAMAEMLQRYGMSAIAVDGSTDEEERRRHVDTFRDGKFQALCNCNLYLEGADFPAVSCIVMARPTNSRALYCQAVGRALRGGPRCPIPGKTDALIIDLVGASKHKLRTTADLLGGRYDEEVLEEIRKNVYAQARQGEGGADTMACVLEAASRAEEIKSTARRSLIAEAKLKRKTIDPFSLLGETMGVETAAADPGWWQDMQCSDDQRAKLEKAGIKAEGDITYTDARRLLATLAKRKRDGVCSYKQAKMLRARGLDPNMSQLQASAFFDARRRAAQASGLTDEKDIGQAVFGFSRDDAIRQSIVKKRGGRPMQFTELRGMPRFVIPPRTEAEVLKPGGVAPVAHVTQRPVYVGSVVMQPGDRCQCQADGFRINVAAERVYDLQKGRFVATAAVKVAGGEPVVTGKEAASGERDF